MWWALRAPLGSTRQHLAWLRVLPTRSTLVWLPVLPAKSTLTWEPFFSFFIRKREKGGPSANGRVLPPVTGRSQVRVPVSSHCTDEDKARYWHLFSDPTQSRRSLHCTPLLKKRRGSLVWLHSRSALVSTESPRRPMSHPILPTEQAAQLHPTVRRTNSCTHATSPQGNTTCTHHHRNDVSENKSSIASRRYIPIVQK